MINSDPIILLPGTCLIVPERVDARRVCSGPNGIGEAEIEEGVKRLAEAYREVESPAHAA